MANTFIDLNDTPSDYSNNELSLIQVNSDGTELTFAEINAVHPIHVINNQGNITLAYAATAVTPGAYGNATHVPMMTVDAYGRITSINEVEIVPLSGFVDEDGNIDLSMVTTLAFSEIRVTGKTSVLADNKSDILTLEAGAGITINTSPSLDKIIFSADVSSSLNESSVGDLEDIDLGTSPSNGDVLIWNTATAKFEPGIPGSGATLADLSGGVGIDYNTNSGVIALANTAVTPGTYGSTSAIPQITVDAQGRITDVVAQPPVNATSAKIERFRLNYNSSGDLVSTANPTAGITSINIDSATGGEVTITFNAEFNYPPASVMIYGYNYNLNTYVMTPLETSMSTREVAAGGTSGNPTLFDGTDTVVVKLRLREAETGASRGSFGTVTHAWLQFVMY